MSTQTQQLAKQRGGKRAKKQKKHSDNHAVRNLILKEAGQEYAQVERTLGNCRFAVKCFDGHMRLAKIRGKLTKGKNKHENLIGDGDYVLVGTRDYEPDKCDIILKYSLSNVKDLIRQGELPEGSQIPTITGEEDEDIPFSFEDI